MGTSRRKVLLLLSGLVAGSSLALLWTETTRTSTSAPPSQQSPDPRPSLPPLATQLPEGVEVDLGMGATGKRNAERVAVILPPSLWGGERAVRAIVALLPSVYGDDFFEKTTVPSTHPRLELRPLTALDGSPVHDQVLLYPLQSGGQVVVMLHRHPDHGIFLFTTWMERTPPSP